MNINADGIIYDELNNIIKSSKDDLDTIDNCIGQRFIGAGMSNKTLNINGVPGNALGAYLDGGTINVFGNGQDAVGDTMNEGKIVIHGDVGDALGYAMRGGSIYVLGNTGYRTGIHMKQYKEKKPTIIIGGKVGSFLGEYIAGGVIVVLNLNDEKDIVGNFTGTGMHGGKIYLRTNKIPSDLPSQVDYRTATAEDMDEIKDKIIDFGREFDINSEKLLKDDFLVLIPNAKNPYKQLYVTN